MKKKLSLCIALLTIFSMLFTGCNLSGSLQGTAVDQNSETTITENGVETTYETFSEAWEYANSHTDVPLLVTLKGDVNCAEIWINVNGRTEPLTIDLNNHTINRVVNNSKYEFAELSRTFTMEKPCTLTVKNGTLTGGRTISNGGCFYIDNSGIDLTLENVTIKNSIAKTQGGGIAVASAKKVTLKNCLIENNSAYIGGGGVFIDNSDAELILEGVTVKSNSTPKDGAGVFISAAKKVTLKNCQIENNSTDSNGGGVYMTNNKSNVILDNVNITGNSGTKGAGMYLHGSKSSATLKNVTITNNTASECFAGLYWGKTDTDDSSYMAGITMEDKVVIKDNTSAKTGLNNDFFKANGNYGADYLNLDNLGEGSDIHISVAGEGLREIAYVDNSRENTIINYLTLEDENCSFDILNHVIRIKDKKASSESNKDTEYVARIYYNGEWTYYKTFARAWVTANAWSDHDITLQLLDDWKADSNGDLDDANGYGANDFGWYNNMLNPRVRDNEDSWFIVDLNNHTINKNLYRVGAARDWKNPTRNKAKDYGTIFYIDDDINMKVINGTLKGGNTTGNGGAIWLNDKNVNLELTDLAITENRSTGDGSAIWINNCHWVKLSNVNVQYNYTDLDDETAGAVVFKDGELYFNQRIRILNNCGKNPLNANEKYDSDNNLVLHEYIAGVNLNPAYGKSNIHLSAVTTTIVREEDKKYQRIADYDIMTWDDVHYFNVNDYHMKKEGIENITSFNHTFIGYNIGEYWAIYKNA